MACLATSKGKENIQYDCEAAPLWRLEAAHTVHAYPAQNEIALADMFVFWRKYRPVTSYVPQNTQNHDRWTSVAPKP